PSPRLTLFPYTPLFRSLAARHPFRPPPLALQAPGSQPPPVRAGPPPRAARRWGRRSPGQPAPPVRGRPAPPPPPPAPGEGALGEDRKSTRLNSSHVKIS